MKNKKHDNYFEAILQLRPATDEVVNFVKNEIENQDYVFISKIVELKTGIDIYLSSNNFAKGLGKKLKHRFKTGILKYSSTLHTRSKLTSKDLYRLTVSFRL